VRLIRLHTTFAFVRCNCGLSRVVRRTSQHFKLSSKAELFDVAYCMNVNTQPSFCHSDSLATYGAIQMCFDGLVICRKRGFLCEKIFCPGNFVRRITPSGLCPGVLCPGEFCPGGICSFAVAPVPQVERRNPAPSPAQSSIHRSYLLPYSQRDSVSFVLSRRRQEIARDYGSSLSCEAPMTDAWSGAGFGGLQFEAVKLSHNSKAKLCYIIVRSKA